MKTQRTEKRPRAQDRVGWGMMGGCGIVGRDGDGRGRVDLVGYGIGDSINFGRKFLKIAIDGWILFSVKGQTSIEKEKKDKGPDGGREGGGGSC